MKLIKVMACCTALMMALTACGSSEEESNGGEEATAKYTAGTVEATATGFGGEFTVSVEFGDNEIISITAGENSETPDLGGKAIETLSAAMVEAQSSEVDAVAGATVTSDAFKAAVAQAIETATIK